ncbi:MULTISPECIES: hypothetical protein [unclassified Aureimonas]|uniref:hypothetical protein n=1 Tax=unclassified Aureimonas TaxID=2615206 RepID=UPI0009E79211|nr:MULTISPECIES: hypothetical protein [unclassified Aureimonas]
MRITLDLDLTTQGPLYPPSEVMDEEGNFIVIGTINRAGGAGVVTTEWGHALVRADSVVPAFGERAPYTILEEFGPSPPPHIGNKILHTLPLPLPCSNYPMLFAPEQYPAANQEHHPSYAFHETPIPDASPEHGRALSSPVRLRDWMAATGQLRVHVASDSRSAAFEAEFAGLIPNSLYTVMTLRERDLNPSAPTRPGPLGIPNVFVTDRNGAGSFYACLPNPFPRPDSPGANRVVNVVVLWMSYQLSHGGAIGRYGLGGDIHAQLKLRAPAFHELQTQA